MKKVIYTEKSLESLKEITDFLKYKWTEKEREILNDDILKFIKSINEGILTYPKYKKNSEIRVALISKKQVKVFFETTDSTIEIYLFWANKKNPKNLRKLLGTE